MLFCGMMMMMFFSGIIILNPWIIGGAKKGEEKPNLGSLSIKMVRRKCRNHKSELKPIRSHMTKNTWHLMFFLYAPRRLKPVGSVATPTPTIPPCQIDRLSRPVSSSLRTRRILHTISLAFRLERRIYGNHVLLPVRYSIFFCIFTALSALFVRCLPLRMR
jgi:hypothetical protein